MMTFFLRARFQRRDNRHQVPETVSRRLPATEDRTRVPQRDHTDPEGQAQRPHRMRGG